MEDSAIVNKTGNLKNDYEKFRLNYALTLESVKIFPWELDVASMKIDNIFGTDILFSENSGKVDLERWMNIIHPEDKALIIPEIMKILSGETEGISVEYRVNKNQADYIWVKTVSKIRARDESGKPQIIVGVSQDITESKLLELANLKKEKKIHDNESRLKNAMKIGRMSPWEYNYETGSIITDSQMAAVWGLSDLYSRGEPVKIENLLNNIHPDDRENVSVKFRISIETNENFELNFRIIIGDNIKFIHFVGEVIPGDGGKPLKILGIAQDITRMKVLEDSLAKQEKGLRFIAEKAGIGLWSFNIKERYISILTRDVELSGPDSIYKRISVNEFMESISPEDQMMINDRFGKNLNMGNDVSDFDVYINRGNENYRWYHITSVIDQRDSAGNVLTFSGLYQDITERKEIEERLYQSQKMEAIGRLAGGIAHDFNNLLQVILGYGSLALMDAGNNADMLENITHIIDSGEKAKGLVRQLLLFAKREKFRPRPVALKGLISGFVKMFKRVIGENISITYSYEEELQYIHGDTGQLEQVFMNLCINSRDAIEGSGSITLKTRNISIDDYWPCFDNSIPPGSYVMVGITDTGAGIPAENISHIFEPFFSTKDKNRSTGLGLATVYSIVKQHNGFIDVHSLEDKGTTFSIYFPVYGEDIKSPVLYEHEATEKNSYVSETLLLAEDDDLIRKYTERILSDSGYKVISASDGEMAVRLFNENKDEIDMLIFDVVMPKKNGWDVYNEISGIRKDIPVIFFSGYDQNLLPADAVENIPMVYVQKPFKYYTILKGIHDLLDKKRTY